MMDMKALPRLDTRVWHKNAHEIVGRLMTYNAIPRTVTVLLDDGNLYNVPYEDIEHARDAARDRVRPIKMDTFERVYPVTKDLEEAYRSAVNMTRHLRVALDAARQEEFDASVALLKRG